MKVRICLLKTNRLRGYTLITKKINFCKPLWLKKRKRPIFAQRENERSLKRGFVVFFAGKVYGEDEGEV